MKKALSLLLILVMLIGMMPMQAFATEGTQETEAVEVVTEPTEAPEEETTAPAEETEPSEEEEKTEPSGEEEETESPDEGEETESPDEEEETEPSEPSEPEEEAEIIHEHDYEAVVTDPTCTEQGYTTYTCECGDSYVEDCVDATGHSYKNGICTICKFESSTTLVITEFVNGTYSSNSLTSYPNTRLRHDPISVKAGDQCSFSLPDGWSGYICLAYQDQNWDYAPKAWVREYTYTFLSDMDAFVVMRKDDGSVISPDEYAGEIVFTRKEANPDGDVPLQSYYQGEIDQTIESVKALISDEPCLVFPMVSDIHYLESSTVPNSFDFFIANLKELSKEINFDFIACLGDVTEGDTTQEITSERNTHIINGFTQLGVPYYQVIGNHDDNRYGDTTFTHEQLYENYLSTITDVVFDTSSMHKTNYYKDFDDLGIRCIFLNANTNGAYGYSDETCDWFDEAIKTENGIIVFTHIPPVPSQNYGAKYGTDKGSTRIRESCANADNFLIMLSGHNHYDLAITDPFLSFTMNCQKFENENGDPSLWAEGAVKPQRVAGTETEDCFDIVVVRPESGRIDLVRFGAGEDRSFRVESAHTHSYTITVTAPTCTEQGYTTYTCACGDSYVGDYVDATGDHTYENGICTGCGEKLSFEGKTISILGDSISTFAGISDDSTVNATLSGSTIYYGQGALGGYRHTWWQQIIDTLGMDLLVNNSWSGTCVLKTRGTVGAYIDRCVQLHNDRTGEQPDVIAVFMGTNDYSYYQSTLGTAEIDYAALITDRGDGTFDYAKPTTTCEAYAIMLHKMTQRYPDAEIYCLGMLSRRDPDHDGREVVPPPTSFNAELKAIVERFGGTYVDVESVIPATASEFDRYMSDRRVHPNAAGMDKITEAVVGTMLQRQVTLRNVSYDLHNVSCSKEPAAVIENEPFELTLTATDKDLDLAVRVTMGGEDITSECYANGKVSIAKITGDIVITAMVLHGPSDYQWQFDNGELVSAGTNANQLTKLAGSTQDNVFSQTRYQLAVTAELIHTRPWVIEWAGEGKGGFMLSQTSSSTGAPFFFRRSGNYLTAFGHYNNNRYDNYGLTLDAANIDGAAKHVYRLENRIAQNGNNMVWVLVDGIEIGALNNYYISGTSQGSTADWISGKDFHINYIGSSTHPLSGYALEYLSITECAHIFSNGICTGCGATQPGPVITQQPESVEQEIGKKFAITVKAEGEGLTYQWYIKEAGAKAFKVSSNKTSSYAYTMQSYMHNRQVYCVITDANGNSVQTETATITRPPMELKILEQPKDVQQEVGQKFSISPKVQGEGLKYQWYYKESYMKEFKPSSNKTSAYAYSMVAYMNKRSVYCVITDQSGNTVTTEVATISLPPVELKILEQPSDVYAEKGEKFSIKADVQGDGLTYQWYYKESYQKKFSASSNKTSAYAYSMQTYMNNRSVYCVITDQYGNQVQTEAVTIHLEK